MYNKLEEINLEKNLDKNLEKNISNNIDEIKKLNNKQKIETKLNENIEQRQKSWTESELFKIIDKGLDDGIRALLPDYLEEGVIELKNTILNGGFEHTIGDTINKIVEISKENGLLVNNKFDSVQQVKDTLISGNFINGIDTLLDKEINKLGEKELINEKSANKLKKEKNTIIEKIEDNLELSFNKQEIDVNKIEKNISNWKSAFNNQDYNLMKKEYKEIKKIMETVMPLESIIDEYKTIQNLQELIKNNGKNFDLSQEEMELANKLIK